jgi:T4 RnlA family RNA ligase
MYKEIPTYDDCLKIVSDCKAFSHSTQEKDGCVIESFKYNLHAPDMWIDPMRLSMRGITFVDQKLAALPFPKFFNMGENESTTNVDLNDVLHIYEKIDGSLISFFVRGDTIDIKTMRSVESDVANEAREFLNGCQNRDIIWAFAEMLIGKNLSPMFEYVSPTSRIVIDYGKTDLLFLGCRDMTTGEIILPHRMITDIPHEISLPQIFPDRKEMEEYMEKDDVEGVVVTFGTGLMMKLKTDTYCKIHRIMDNFIPKKIVLNVIENTFDDVIGIFAQHGMEEEIESAEKIRDKYYKEYSEYEEAAKILYNSFNPGTERKLIAQKLFSLEPEVKKLAPLVFNLLDGNESYMKGKIDKFILEEAKDWQFG